MLSNLKKNIKILKIYFKYNVAKEMENRGSFLLQIIFMMFNDASFIVQWFVFFSLKNIIGGYDFKSILLLWALTSTTYGISHIFFENVYSIPELIINGKLDAYITQPLNVLWNVSLSKTNPLAFGDLIYGITLAIISVGTDLKKIILFMLFAFMGGIILTAFSALIGSLVFWLKRGEQFVHSLIFAVTVSGTYPEGVFKGVTKLLFYTIIPIGFIVYTPLKIILSFNIVLLFCLFLITILFVFLSFYAFKKGLKRYSSSNLMNARV